MKVLVVDDDSSKILSILECINSVSNQLDLDVSTAGNLSDAARLINSCEFDMIVLDLMLPYYADGQVDSRAGLEILRQIRRRDSLNSSAEIFGLSAFPDELREARGDFERLGVLIISYDEEGIWRETLKELIVTCQKEAMSKRRLDFVILVALEEERAGFDCTLLSVERDAIVSGLNVRFVALNSDKVSRGAIIKLRQMGLVASTMDTSIAIASFRPKILCMSGICAGISANAELGQLIVASPAWEYQAGKWSENGFEIAPHQIQMRPATRVIIEQTLDIPSLISGLEVELKLSADRPRRRAPPKIAPAVTGSAVIANKDRLLHIEQQHRKVAAIDMETYGVYFASHESPWFIDHYFSVKSVVDLADKDKSDDLHEYGVKVSARACVSLIISLLFSIS